MRHACDKVAFYPLHKTCSTAKLCKHMLLYIIILHKNMVSVIRHIQLSNMGPVPKWSDKWHSTVLWKRSISMSSNTFGNQHYLYNSCHLPSNHSCICSSNYQLYSYTVQKPCHSHGIEWNIPWYLQEGIADCVAKSSTGWQVMYGKLPAMLHDTQRCF